MTHIRKIQYGNKTDISKIKSFKNKQIKKQNVKSKFSYTAQEKKA